MFSWSYRCIFCLWFNHFPVSKRLGNLFVQFEFCFGSSCNPDLCRDTLLVSHRHRMYSDFADHFDILHALKLKHYSQDWRVNVDIVSIPISSTNLQQLLWFVHTHTHTFFHICDVIFKNVSNKHKSITKNVAKNHAVEPLQRQRDLPAWSGMHWTFTTNTWLEPGSKGNLKAH